MADSPRLLITLGDVAGIGPEIVAKAWPELYSLCRPVVVGDPLWLRRGLELSPNRAMVRVVERVADAEPAADLIPCLHASGQDLSDVRPGKVSGAAGRAAYDFLCKAIDLTRTGEAEGIVTAPLHKEGLRAAGLSYPGHTEILAERCGVQAFAMVLAVQGLAVAHVTLHMALRDVFAALSTSAIVEKAELLHDLLWKLLGRQPRLGIAALNPHASDGGLFGYEEERVIAPAVAAARASGLDASGPWPTDTLFVRAKGGEFDGVVAMFHDQGHIALKLMGMGRAVNISVGLPIVRTSVAHGTAYDIAGHGVADAGSLLEAARVAAVLTAATPGGGRRAGNDLSPSARSTPR
jgi:4-hydroxythreonine-4-phosphate dehydrogenase